MAEQRSARNVPDPIVVALRLCLAEALETRRQRELERDRRRRTLTVVDGGRRRDAA